MDHQAVRADAGPSTNTATYPSAPLYDFSSSPSSLLGVDADELESGLMDNFWRTARWSPDGSCILTTSEDRMIRLFDTPPNEAPDPAPRSIPCPDSVLSAAWYPLASASSPEAFCFATGIRDSPVRLIDASDGRVRATYPIVDHRERFIAPWSMAFNPSASKLYCGHENAIEILDIASPGYDNADRLKTSFTRRDKGGQKGIISALAFCPDYSGLYAAGSFAGSVSLYAEETPGAVGHLEGVHGGGVTQVAFHPLLPHIMFVTSRRSFRLQAYDTRNPSESVIEYERSASTNQRLAFDVDPWGRWLAAGDEHGIVHIWDISDMAGKTPIWKQNLHQDAVSAVQFHPYRPILMTASGSRSFTTNGYESDDTLDSGSSCSADSNAIQSDRSHRSLPLRATDRRLCLHAFIPPPSS